MKAKVICPGYQDEIDLIFRRYRKDGSDRSNPRSTGSPFELQIPSPLYQGNLHQRPLEDVEFEQRALAAFVDDYCIVPKDNSLSRGYLDGLEDLLARSSLAVAKAANIAGLASLGNKLDRPHLIHRAKTLYPDALCTFQVTMSKGSSPSTESLTIAVLLGLYEVTYVSAPECTWRPVTNIQIISATS